MRIFRRKPKYCETLSFSYNRNKPEEGIMIHFGAGEDKLLPGLPEKDIAYHRIEVDEIEWLIEQLRQIQCEYSKGE